MLVRLSNVKCLSNRLETCASNIAQTNQCLNHTWPTKKLEIDLIHLDQTGIGPHPLSSPPFQHSLVSRLLAPLLSVFQLETTNLVITLLTPSPTFPLTLLLQLLIFSLKICSAMQNQAYELTWDLSLLVGQQCNFLKILIWKVEINWEKTSSANSWKIHPAHSGWDSGANAVKKPKQKWKRLSIPGTVIDPCTIWRHIGLLPYKGTILVYTYLQN